MKPIKVSCAFGTFTILTAVLLVPHASCAALQPQAEHGESADANVPQPMVLVRKPRFVNRAKSLVRSGFCSQRQNHVDCVRAKMHAKMASKETRRRYPRAPENGDGDAFRQCYWCARMSMQVGKDRAKVLSNRIERIKQKTWEMKMKRRMDVNNNIIGLRVGQQKDDFRTAADECAHLANSGGLLIFNGRALVPSGTTAITNNRVWPH